MKLALHTCYLTFFCLVTGLNDSLAQRVMESLKRGLTAIPQSEGKSLVSWRLSALDPPGLAFNLHRRSGGQPPVELNHEPLATSAGFTDEGLYSNRSYTYILKTVSNAKESRGLYSFQLTAHPKRHISLPLQIPVGYAWQSLGI